MATSDLLLLMCWTRCVKDANGAPPAAVSSIPIFWNIFFELGRSSLAEVNCFLYSNNEFTVSVFFLFCFLLHKH